MESFGFHDEMAIPLVNPTSTRYQEIPAEFPGVITEANTSQHESDDDIPGDMDEDFTNAAMAVAQNAGLDDPRNAPVHPNVVVTDDGDHEEEKKKMMLMMYLMT